MLANILSRYWWMILLRGLAWLVFGLLVFTQPAISLVTLTLLFGAFVLVDGITNTVSAIGGRRENEHWGALLLTGLAGIGIGALTFVNPAITALGLLFYIAIWVTGTGLLAVVTGIRLRKEIQGEFWLILSGLVSIAAGVFLVARPGPGALSVLWLIASYAMLFGIILIMLAFRVRSFANRVAGAMRG
jgi:uncharacterized membrane protein HdeD (DUF308 family)